jgi:hypothetical protein
MILVVCERRESSLALPAFITSKDLIDSRSKLSVKRHRHSYRKCMAHVSDLYGF